MKNRKKLIIFSVLLSLLLVCVCSIMILATETSEAGDVNGDGSVTSADATYRSFCHDIIKHFITE